jgi:UDP-N-acetyl-D-galactosamine dehydrogenase
MIKISIIGLGYVGLPVALTLSSKYNVIGYDINKLRVRELSDHVDTNNEFKKKDFLKKNLIFTSDLQKLKSSNFYIICVPTPITNNFKPDLSHIKKSIEMLSKIIKKKDIIILESTVYPGVTSKFSKILEKKTKLIDNEDFFMCYSPERVNPGDNSKKLKKINKIFATKTSDNEVLKKIKNVYKLISKKLIITQSIKEAETAKALENTQRDLNIALLNEILIMCEKLNLNFKEVIKLASSKWNFLNFLPGLVGGHCLPVDPYYLAHIASKKKFKTKVLLSGRDTNNYMKDYVVKKVQKIILEKKLTNKINILIVGITYKYGVADIRNSLNLKILKHINNRYNNTYYYDPFIKKNSILDIKESNKFSNHNLIIFLSHGPKFKKVFNIVKKNKSIIFDPFHYYS